jgi:hypothetical protein
LKKWSELSEMARTLIGGGFFDGSTFVGGLRGDLGFLRAQTQELRTPLGMRQYILICLIVLSSKSIFCESAYVVTKLLRLNS